MNDAFDAVLQDCGLPILRSLAKAPRANATCERLIGSIRREVLDQTPVLNQNHLRTVLTEYVAHYNTARPHRGIAQRVPDDDPDQPAATVTDLNTAHIRRRPVLGGIISEYHIAA